MKKIVLCLALMCTLLLTGCNGENVSLNLKELSTTIDNLTEKNFSRVTANTLLETELEKTEFIYDTEFKEKLGLDKDKIEEYSVGINDEEKTMYFIVKPIKEEKETIKKQIEDYLKTIENLPTLSQAEMQDYLIYIAADNSQELLQKVKECKDPIFNGLMEVDDDLLTQQLGLTKDMIEEYVIKVPMMITSSSSYMIIKPASGKKEAVQEKMNEYMNALENQWKTYLPDQYELVRNRLEKEYGDYLIYIISSDNNLVWETIQEHNQK